ncbi:MAG: integration host factor subunit alpha [Deltaproteobacteria bacterium]|nr:integration host factor subunit alpha [Deltaproteobacteria bacterium]
MSNTLNKSGIINAIEETTGYSRKNAADTIETVLEIIKSTLASGDYVLISGFGKFCVNQKQKRRGRNPATGEEMMIEPRKVVTFRCSKKLREKVNQKNK